MSRVTPLVATTGVTRDRDRPVTLVLDFKLYRPKLQVRYNVAHSFVSFFTRKSSSAPLRRPYLAQCGTAAVLFGTKQAIEKRGRGNDVHSGHGAIVSSCELRD